ncbi:MAG: polyprenyl synthetase family protein [Aquificaceae bacterium]|nr:polyprenyl synthetase family protein [Aquificaceae bacterium]MDW8237758.1 polyprenyl synthetase family protein [Aquificaceae bacterium]
MDAFEKLNLWRKSINSRLRELLLLVKDERLREALSYYPLQEGKRLRPLSLVATCDALSGNLDDAITLGCAIELIHAYSLIHDDLPNLDNATFRRNLPAFHIRFGDDIAILAGDGLLTLAFEVLSKRELYKSLDERALLRAIHLTAVKSGPSGMVLGQALELYHHTDREYINLLKTAELFSLCFMLGGLCANLEDLSALEALGKRFGICFQMLDDLRDKDGLYLNLGSILEKKLISELKSLLTSLKELSLFTKEIEIIMKLAFGETIQELFS